VNIGEYQQLHRFILMKPGMLFLFFW
jgi:hypothetical protein